MYRLDHPSYTGVFTEHAIQKMSNSREPIGAYFLAAIIDEDTDILDRLMPEFVNRPQVERYCKEPMLFVGQFIAELFKQSWMSSRCGFGDQENSRAFEEKGIKLFLIVASEIYERSPNNPELINRYLDAVRCCVGPRRYQELLSRLDL